jgi:hypothetical protein
VPREHAILGLSQLRDADRQPDSRCGQGGGKNKGGEIRQHPMPEFVVIVESPVVGRLRETAGLCVWMGGSAATP